MLRGMKRGAASLIIVMVVSVILTILTLSFIRLAISEQRSASDTDLTNRAYYAAESGVEDAKRAIRSVLGGSSLDLRGDDCSPPDSSQYSNILSDQSGFDVEYTCQLIDLTPSSYKAEFDGANQSVQLPLSAVDADDNPANFNRLTIKWHINAESGAGGDGLDPELRTVTDQTLTDVNTWNGNDWPAMLRANIFWYNENQNITRNRIDQYTVFLNPTRSGSGDGGNVNSGIWDGQIIDANCDPNANSGQYVCEASFNGFSNSNQFYLRLGSLYRGAQFEVELSQGNNERSLAGAQALIDVTGRAADVFRRVETTVDLSDFNILPNFVITSSDDICKDFGVADNASNFTGIANTSCSQP